MDKIVFNITERIDEELKYRGHDQDCTLYIEPDKGKSCDCIVSLLYQSKELIESLDGQLYDMEVNQTLYNGD